MTSSEKKPHKVGNGIPVGDGRSSAHRRRSPFPTWLAIVIVLAALIVIWDLSTALKLVDPLIVSTPLAVARSIPEILGSSEGQSALEATGYELVIAFVIGTGAGFVIGVILGISSSLRKAYLPIVAFLLGTPKVVFLPIFMTALGISQNLAIAFGAFEAFFYVVINVEGGVESVDRRHIRAAHAYRANPRQILTSVIIPSAMPGISTGFWYGVKHAFLGVLVAELFASQVGVGALVKEYSDRLDSAHVIGIVLIVSIVAIVAGVVWSRIEERLGRWRKSSTTGSIEYP